MRVLGVGDNCIDHYVELGKKYPGGNALNLAVYSSRYHDVEADYIGVVGTDENGEYLMSEIRKQDLPTDKIIIMDGANAVTKILVKDGDRVFDDYVEGVQMDAILPTVPYGYDLIHFVVWGFGREHVATIKNAVLSCDFSSKLDDPRTAIMQHLDYSFFSGSHLIAEGKDPSEKIRELKERTKGVVVMTLGEHGSIVHDGDNVYRGKALPVEVVDSLGAGDAYIAAFLVSRLRGGTIQESIDAGHLAARDICKRLGAWGGPD